MTLSKAQKWLAFVLVCVGMLSAAGNWLYLPKRVEGVEDKVKDLNQRFMHDHDILTRIDAIVQRIEKQLERGGIIQYDNNKYSSSNHTARIGQ